MPSKLIGTLIALLFLGTILNISTIILLPRFANAQLSELSEIQNGTFHLSHKNIGFTSETFKTDKYIDEEQAKYFSDLSKPALNTPADGDYPFSLVDSYLLDTDLEIDYDYEYILGPYPPRTYLSRNDYSIADYTDQKSPPEFYLTGIKATEPFHGDKVVAASAILNNYEYEVNEHIYHYDYNDPNNGSFDSYISNLYVRVSGKWAVWAGDTHQDHLFEKSIPENSCLPQSDIKQPNVIQIIRTPYDTSHPGNWPATPLLLAPRSHCYYPFPQERDSAAATNWSYNYNTNTIPTTKSKSACQNCQ